MVSTRSDTERRITHSSQRAPRQPTTELVAHSLVYVEYALHIDGFSGPRGCFALSIQHMVRNRSAPDTRGYDIYIGVCARVGGPVLVKRITASLISNGISIADDERHELECLPCVALVSVRWCIGGGAPVHCTRLRAATESPTFALQ